MNPSLFIAKRIVAGRNESFSKPIIRVSIAGIAIGFCVMFISIAILTGFQNQIREKVIGFGSHIQISHFNENPTAEPQPISIHQPFYPNLEHSKGIKHIQVYATKSGIIKANDQIQGVVLKGVGKDFDWSFFKEKIEEGAPFKRDDSLKSNEVLISRSLSNLLNIKLNDDVRMFFLSGNTTLGRKFKVCGIYETGLGELDNLFVLADIRHIQKLNGWKDDEVEGFEVFINNFDEIDKMEEFVYKGIGFSFDATSIKDLYPQIFDWLNLQDTNVVIILALMVLVAGITMISTLLILILEKTNLIGILKALGMKNRDVRRIFLYHALYIVGLGIAIGNLVGFGLCLFQQKTGLIQLSQESYYVSVVPIHLDLIHILILNVGTLFVCFCMLIVPTYIITKVNPVSAIRYD